MKARVKATGKIVEVYSCGERYLECSNMNKSWWEEDLDFDVEGKFAENCLNGIKQDNAYTPDYWTRLEHQYAGMAMQGLLSNERCWEENADKIAEVAICYAKELVKGLRIERSN